MSDGPHWFMSDCATLRAEMPERHARNEVLVCDLTSGTDALFKRRHRRDLSQWLSHGGSAIVRVNDITTPFCGEDVEEVLGLAGLDGILLPNVRVPAALRGFIRRVVRSGDPVWAEIDSAEGVSRVADICGEGIAGIVFQSRGVPG